MTNKRSTKHALLMSALALLLCVSMLIGSTYAWFTDSVVSKNNIIKSGTLDVEMMWKDAASTGKQTTYKDASEGAIFNSDKWEPGYVEAKNIKITNIGTLALKYQLSILANGEVSELADVIDVYYADGEKTLTNRDLTEQGLTLLGKLTDVLAAMSSTASGNLKAGENHTVTLALKMQESADNKYQDKSIGSDFEVKLLATQLTSENDSFDDKYDKMATIDDIDELNEALAADYDLISLGANITATESIVIPEGKTVAIDLAGYTLSQEKGDITTAYALIDNKGTLTIEDSIGTGKISFADTTPYTADIGWASNTIRNTGVLTVNGGTIENLTSKEVLKFSYPHAIDCYQGSVTTINGGTVKSANYDSIRMFCNSTTLATTVNINGGTIINRVSFQNPNNNTHTAGYGVLNITGGNFVTTDDVNANVRLLNFSRDYSNMKATVTGGTFDKGFKTQDYASCGVVTSDWLTYSNVILPVVVSDEKDLNNVLANGGNAVLADDMNFTATASNAYGATGTSVFGGVLDGNGNEFGVNNWGTWDSAINITAGTVKNITVNSGMRGIFINHNSTVQGKVYLENVIIDGTIYTISCDQGTNNGLEAVNSTFNGWTSYAATIGDVKFENCSFGEGQGYAYCRPYAPTEFIGCDFEEGYAIDARAAVTFENCTIGGEALTADNLATLVTSNISNATVK